VSEAFVVDASIAVAWVHPAQATPQTDSLLESVYEGAPLELPLACKDGPLRSAATTFCQSERSTQSDSFASQRTFARRAASEAMRIRLTPTPGDGRSYLNFPEVR
jgi:hypothetical protein